MQYSSCRELNLTCGPDGLGSCCELAETVEGGAFYRGYDAASDAYNDMTYQAMVSTFVLDKYEVTVGRFRAFVEGEDGRGLGTRMSPPAERAGAHPRLANSGWDRAWNASLVADTAEMKNRVKCNSTFQTWTDTPGGNENKPMTCVTWYEAMAFCIWDGGYLPTEAEWNYVASGGSQHRAYPWSIPESDLTISCSHANNNNGNPCVNPPYGAASRVGSLPTGNGRWKHSDLAGNVSEWVLDWYVAPYPYPQTCDDCANLMPGTTRVFRGGGFYNVASYLRAAYRFNYGPIGRDYYLGFRCARTP